MVSLDILQEVMKFIESGILKPNITDIINGLSQESAEKLCALTTKKIGKTVVVFEWRNCLWSTTAAIQHVIIVPYENKLISSIIVVAHFESTFQHLAN